MNPSTLNLLKWRGYWGVLHILKCVKIFFCQMLYENRHKRDYNALVQWLTSSFLTLKNCIQIMMSESVYSIALVPLRICSQSTLELVVDCLVQPCELLCDPTIASSTLVPHNMGTYDNSSWGHIAKIPFCVDGPNCLTSIPKVVFASQTQWLLIIFTLVMEIYLLVP